MEAYVESLQFTKYYDVTVPVLRCCINAGSTTGYCSQCLENFSYRNGYYWEGFIHQDDNELLDRVQSGKKPWATIACEEEDEVLEYDIEDRRGLHIVSANVNEWGVICYEIIKDKDLRLLDLADLEKIGDILNIQIDDRALVDIINLDSELNVFKGIVYGYPFYTLHPYDYTRLHPIDDSEEDD